MRPDLDDKLAHDFPALYRERHGDSSDTRMCDGFPGDGWEPLIRRMSEKIEAFCVGTDLCASQVKEKGGMLRVYLESSEPLTDEVRDAVDRAVEESQRTCEWCGAAGQRRRIGWIKTLCPNCVVPTEDEQRAPDRVKGTIRVWLDDVRDAPDGWTRAFTAHEAISLLEAGGVVEISLDHDLGDDDLNGTGYAVVCWIEEQVALHGVEPPAMGIHSANAVGRQRMQRGIESIERLRGREPEMPTPTKKRLQRALVQPDLQSEDQYKPLLARRVPRENIVVGRAYVIHARNGGVGVAVEEDGRLGYVLHREKWGDHYLFTEFDWAEGSPYGTAIPLSLISAEPPEEEEALLAWLSSQQDEHGAEIDAAWQVILGHLPSRRRGGGPE